METRKMLQWVLAGIGITIVVGYSIFVLEGFIRGPQIELATPKTGFSTTTPVITVSGQALRTSVLTLNDSPLPLDLEGNFNERIILALGYNIISVKAEDRYKRSKEERLEINLISTTPVVIATSTATTTLPLDTEEVLEESDVIINQ